MSHSTHRTPLSNTHRTVRYESYYTIVSSFNIHVHFTRRFTITQPERLPICFTYIIRINKVTIVIKTILPDCLLSSFNIAQIFFYKSTICLSTVIISFCIVSEHQTIILQSKKKKVYQ